MAETHPSAPHLCRSGLGIGKVSGMWRRGVSMKSPPECGGAKAGVRDDEEMEEIRAENRKEGRKETT